MSSFDPSTNTPSASFSDAFNCVVMEPATTIQRAYGYQRNNSRRYCEFKINDAGGDPSNLWLGMAYYPYAGDTGPETAVLYGGSSQNVNVSGGQLPSSVPPSNNAFGTISSGQIWQFHVDFGGGTDQDGVQQVFTITDGLGNIFLPICGSFAVNGTWHTTILGPYICAARGFTGHLRPVVMREDHSTSAASVALRVTTASFSLTIPTGAIAWGSGSGQSSLAYKDVRWDVKNASLSWADSSKRAIYQPVNGGSAAFLGQSYAKRKQGRLYLEMSIKNSLSNYDDTATPAIDGIQGGPTVLLYDYSTTYTFTSLAVNPRVALGLYGGGTQYPFVRGTTRTMPDPGDTPLLGFFVDFDAQVVGLGRWTMIHEGSTTGGAFPYGDLSTGSQFYPCTLSVSVEPRCYWGGLAGGNSARYEINGGAYRFNTPFWPGWTSWDGTRFNTIGLGSTWDTSFNTTSVTYMNGNYTVAAFNSASRRVFRAQGVQSSGKRYFEFFVHEILLVAADRVGMIQESALTSNSISFSDASPAIWVGVQATRRAYLTQNGTTISATGSTTLSLVDHPGALGNASGTIMCVAANLDTGKVWFGNWNRSTRTHDWRGGDPVAGTGEHASFTASSSWYPAFGAGVSANKRLTGIFTSAGLIGNLPTGYTAWDGTTSDSSDPGGTTSTTYTSTASTPSSSSLRVLWPYGVQT